MTEQELFHGLTMVLDCIFGFTMIGYVAILCATLLKSKIKDFRDR